VRSAPEVPGLLQPLRRRAAAFAEWAEEDVAHVLVTEYAPGAGIGWHRDRPEFGEVVGVSLLAPATLRFRRRQDAGWARLSQVVEPRSVYHLSGAARDQWQHSIPPLDVLRYSITFRSALL
jgi:alkylated DNA repair dioxygenase AlkB